MLTEHYVTLGIQRLRVVLIWHKVRNMRHSVRINLSTQFHLVYFFSDIWVIQLFYAKIWFFCKYLILIITINIFTQLYGFKNSYGILIIFEQFELNNRSDPNRYYHSK